jgi:hypothetical protein
MAERDHDTVAEIQEMVSKFRWGNELGWACLGGLLAFADSASRHEPDTRVGRLAWIHVQGACP